MLPQGSKTFLVLEQVADGTRVRTQTVHLVVALLVPMDRVVVVDLAHNQDAVGRSGANRRDLLADKHFEQAVRVLHVVVARIEWVGQENQLLERPHPRMRRQTRSSWSERTSRADWGGSECCCGRYRGFSAVEGASCSKANER